MVINSTELGILFCLLPLAWSKSVSEPLFLLENKELNLPLNIPLRIVEDPSGCERTSLMVSPRLIIIYLRLD